MTKKRSSSSSTATTAATTTTAAITTTTTTNNNNGRRKRSRCFCSDLMLIIIMYYILLFLCRYLIMNTHTTTIADTTTTTTVYRTIDNNNNNNSNYNYNYNSNTIPPPPIHQTKETIVLCHDDLVYVADVVPRTKHHFARRQQQQQQQQQQQRQREPIPRVIYQTSKSRCVTPKFYELIQRWRSPSLYDAHTNHTHTNNTHTNTNNHDTTDTSSWEYHFHDESAMIQFLHSQSSDFPLLEQVLLCVHKGTVLADLWRYLIIYNYGGYYADIDSVPSSSLRFLQQNNNNNNNNNNYNNNNNNNNYNNNNNNTDALFLVDKYNLMSEYFFGATPGHPLLYYTIQHAIQRILITQDTGTLYPGRTTGPHALLAAFRTFSVDAGLPLVPPASDKPVHAGSFPGTDGRNVVIIGTETEEDEFVIREAIMAQQKEVEYSKMGMRFYLRQLEPTNSSCLKAILMEQMKS